MREEEKWEETRGGANWLSLITGWWAAANQCKAHQQARASGLQTSVRLTSKHQASKAKWPPGVKRDQNHNPSTGIMNYLTGIPVWIYVSMYDGGGGRMPGKAIDNPMERTDLDARTL